MLVYLRNRELLCNQFDMSNIDVLLGGNKHRIAQVPAQQKIHKIVASAEGASKEKLATPEAGV